MALPPKKGVTGEVVVDLGIYQGVIGRQVEVIRGSTTVPGTTLRVRDLDTGEEWAWLEIQESGKLLNLI